MPLITIPEGLVIGTSERIVLPAYSLSAETSKRGKKIGKLAPSAPSLIQLRQAYLLSPEIRPSVDQTYRGEALSMAIGPGEGNKVRVISPVERFVYDKSKNTWQAEGTERRQRVLPSGDQWQAPDGDAFWDEDGLPLKTESDRSTAIRAWEAALGNAGIDTKLAPALASYFWRRDKYNDFAAVYRYSNPGDGPWSLGAYWTPGDDSGSIGVRAVGVEAERGARGRLGRYEKGYLLTEKDYANLKTGIKDIPDSMNLSSTSQELLQILENAKQV